MLLWRVYKNYKESNTKTMSGKLYIKWRPCEERGCVQLIKNKNFQNLQVMYVYEDYDDFIKKLKNESQLPSLKTFDRDQ